MALPLMPKATAIWLIENTSLSFEQISDFCGLHILQVQTLADEEIGTRMTGMDPITAGQLTHEEIQRCEANPQERLVMKAAVTADSIVGRKKTRYTPVAKRQDRPDAIAWIIKYYPDMPDHTICRLLGTTKPMIKSIRTKTHWNSANIKPKSPVQLGLCTQIELDQATKLLAHDES